MSVSEMSTFWGLVISPGKVYEKTVEDGFIVGQACIDMSAPEGARVAVIVNVREIEHTLCILTAGKLDVQRMNVCFGEGEDIAFRIEGEYDVHLTGENLYDERLLEEDEDDIRESDEDTDLDGFIVDDDESENEEEDEAESDAAQQISKKKKLQEDLQNQHQKKLQQIRESKQQEEKKQEPKRRTLKGGVVITEKKTGSGRACGKGDRVSLKYIGRLKENNKVFDQTRGKSLFTFRLGAKEVIDGWDIGIAGMCVGSKRNIVIPARMGYGRAGAQPDIPPNADLVFDVELVKIK